MKSSTQQALIFAGVSVGVLGAGVAIGWFFSRRQALGPAAASGKGAPLLANPVAKRYGAEVPYKGRTIRPSSPAPSGEPWIAWFIETTRDEILYFPGDSEENVVRAAKRAIDSLQPATA
jgi:hypothetical protein